MKRTILSFITLMLIILNLSAQSGKKALLIIDIQNFYFPGGQSALVEPEKVHDACATKDLKFGDKIIKAEDVHYSTLSTLKNYAQVISTKEYLNK